MKRARVFALAGRLLRQLARDRRAAALILLVPMLIMSLLTVLLNTTARPARVSVAATGVASLFIDGIERRPNATPAQPTGLTVVALPDDAAPADAVRRGLVDAALVFPRTFVEDRASGENSRLLLYVDGADPLRTAEIFSAFRTAVPDSLAGLPTLLPENCDASCAAAIPKGPPAIEVVKLSGRGLTKTMDFFTPALPPFFALFFVFLLSGLTFLRERVSGTAERLLASPLQRAELVAGYALGFLPAAFVQASVVILFGRYALGGPWGGWPAVAAIFLLTIVAECLGVFVSAFARTEFQVIQFIPLVVLPQLLLCGLIWPVAGMPPWLKPLAYALPLTYATSLLQGIWNGDGWSAHMGDVAALAVLFFVFTAISAKVFRWE